MKAFKLAFRNLIGAGLRTWLNVGILAFILILMIFQYGIYDGWNRQAVTDMIAWETGGGQIWQENYDPYDPFTLEDSHAAIPASMQGEIEKGNLAPVLVTQATIYPDGRMQSILLKGINPDQQVSDIPTAKLSGDYAEIPAVIGNIMAKNAKLNEGDFVTVRWRDVDGTFDATEALIVGVFKADVPAVTARQMWIPIERLREMTQMSGQATLLIADQEYIWYGSEEGWVMRDHDFLLKEMSEMIRMKKIGGSFIYVILLLLAMLAVFDTQVLSIFRRQKEIGTYMAMGMTRSQVVRLFTVEGAMHSILAVIVGTVPGIPLLMWINSKGIGMPGDYEEFGMAIAERIYPAYSAGLILSVMLIIIITTTIVSFLPSRKISKMNPTEAIKGKLQ
ncbi:MAG: FtsX-like permease family protein [Bacteroidales bacterium]|nr:FtsX-like permease family protein [Bacteroidales bacterium]